MSTSNRIIEVLRDNIWQSVAVVVGIVATFLGVYAAYDIYFREQPDKALQIVILTNTSLIAVEPTIAQDIKITYKDKPAPNLSLIQVKLENNGNQPIRGEDYEEPVKLVFPSKAQLVETAVVETNPPGIDMTAQVLENTVILSPVLLNEGDRVVFRFLVVDLPTHPDGQPFKVEGARIAGVKQIPVINAIKEPQVREPLNFIPPLVINLGFCGGALYGLLVTAVIAKIMTELRVARAQMGRRNQTLDNFPAASQPKRTASGIVSSSQAAGFRYVVLLFALLLVVALSVAGAILILRS